jgi:hypothetical protein
MSIASKRRKIVDNLVEVVARLEKEIADRRRNMLMAKQRYLSRPQSKGAAAGDRCVTTWFAVWSRHVLPLARALGQLGRARARLAKAAVKADHASARERTTMARIARIRAANDGLLARIDARAGDRITERWNKERREEAKREKVRRKQLARRTRKDFTDRPDWVQRPVKLPPPVEQPDVVSEPSLYPKETGPMLGRPDLLPGTYTVIDPARGGGGLVDRPRLPKVWTATYVGVRLIEAHQVLTRMPGTIWPKSYGAAWPEYKVEAGELAIQAGAGTLHMGRGVRVAPSAEAVARMNDAIAWPMRFLADRPGAAADVNRWAADAAFDEMDFDTRSAPWVELQIIADALNARKEAVR